MYVRETFSRRLTFANRRAFDRNGDTVTPLVLETGVLETQRWNRPEFLARFWKLAGWAGGGLGRAGLGNWGMRAA